MSIKDSLHLLLMMEAPCLQPFRHTVIWSNSCTEICYKNAYNPDTFDPSVLELMRQVLRDVELMQSQSSLMLPASTVLVSMPGLSLCGRPHFGIQKDQLSSLIDSGFTVVQITEIIGVSRRTIFRCISDFEQKHFLDLTDTELDYIVKQI